MTSGRCRCQSSLADQPLNDLSDAALVRAIEDNLFAFWGRLFTCSRMTEDGGETMMRFVSGIPFPLLNGIMRAKLPPDDGAIAAALAPIIERKLPMMVWTGPQTTPPDLGERLVRMGFHADSMPGMAVDLKLLLDEPGAGPGLMIAPASDDDMSDYSRVLGESFGVPAFALEPMTEMLAEIAGPDLVHYIARIDGEAIATSCVMLSDGVAGIYNVATVAAARGKGIGRTITLAPLLEAKRRGYRAGILHASKMGQPVYERMGFREYCRIGEYVWMPPSSA